MKIVESNGSASAAVQDWALNLSELDDVAFLEKISSIRQWGFEELEDLSSISRVLNRIDSLLTTSLLSKDLSALSVLLDFSSLLLSSAHSKSLYNSLEEILQVLDLPSWPIVYKALRLLKILNSISLLKVSKAQRNSALTHKLYVIGLGSNLNNPSPISLQDFCSPSPLEKIPFSYTQIVTSYEDLPENLRYVWLNRERTNLSLDSLTDRPLIVASQLLALSVFLQLYPDSTLIQEFCKTLPEIWLLPAVSELLRTPQSLEVQVSSVCLLSSILSILESTRHESYNSQLVAVAREIFASWNGLMLNLLRDVAVPGQTNAPNLTQPEYISSVLDLTQIIAECKYHADTSHLPAMTCSLIVLLKSSPDPPLSLLTKAVRIVSMLLPHTIDMFKEVEGLQTALAITNKHTRLLNDDYEYDYNRFTRAVLVKALLRMIKIALAKWEAVPGLSGNEVRLVLESGLMNSLRECFMRKKYEVFEDAVVLITQMMNESTQVVHDLLANGLILSLLDALETFIPQNPRLIEALSRFLYNVAYNIDGAKLLEEYSIVSKFLVALGTSTTPLFSNNAATSISESLQELIASVPNTKEKVIEGFIELVLALKSSDVSSPDSFFAKLLNTSKLFTQTFGLAPELLKGFIIRGGLDNLLDIFKLPVLSRAANNEFYPLTACFKSLPSALAGQVLGRLFESIKQQLQRLQDITGSLELIKDFSSVPELNNNILMNLLTEGDCYLEIIRVILQNWAGVSNNYKEFGELLQRLVVLQRVLISEQARLLCLGKLKEEPCEEFNVAIDITVIENTEDKSYQENLYFSCQLTIRRIFRLAMKIPNRSRQQSHEEAAIAISNVIGDILTQSLKKIDLNEINFQKLYYISLQLSDIMRVLLYDQGSTPATVLSFHLAGGTEVFIHFLTQLKALSFELKASGKFNYHLVNGLQILWNLCGKFLESLVNGKYVGSGYGQQVLKFLGFESAKEVMKKMQNVALDALKALNFLECGAVSTHFAKSVIEILKVLSNLTKDLPNVDPKIIKSLADMGFAPQVAKQALLATGAASVEMAMEWIFTHPEVMDLAQELEPEVPQMITNLHQKLINAIPCIPSLYPSLSDLLIKISSTNEMNQDEIALMLLTLIGELADSLLQESALKEITVGMAEINLGPMQPTFEQLSAAVHVLQSLAIKIPEILEIVKGNMFTLHAVGFLQKVTAENLGKGWIGSIFAIIDVLIKSGEEESGFDLIIALIRIIEINYKAEVTLLTATEMLSLLNLLTTATFNTVLAKQFLDMNGLKMMLLTKCSKADSQNKAIVLSWNSLAKQLCEDPLILQSLFEFKLLQSLTGRVVLDTFLKGFKPQTERNCEIFDKAFQNVCRVVKQDQVYVERRKDPEKCVAERWDTTKILVESLAEVFNMEQSSEFYVYLNSEKLVSLLADIFQAHPRLISDVLGISLSVYDSYTASTTQKSFIVHLIRTIIPFKYSLKLEDHKILFFYPNSSAPVASGTYQIWIKAAIKLLRSMILKQSYKQPESALSELYTSIVLDNHTGVHIVRKRVTKEIKEILLEFSKKKWFENEKQMTLVRCAATIVLQILREPPKPPFMTTGAVELARLLCSDKLSIMRLLSDCVKGVNLYFKKAGSVFNLLLAPLELLSKYSLNFALKTSKPLEYSEVAIEAYDHENSAEDSEASGNEEQEEDEEAQQEASESSLEEQEHFYDDIVVESWNTEAFWADDIEEEEEEFPRRSIESRNHDLLLAERAILEQDSLNPILNYNPRSILREYEENIPGAMAWGEIENDDIIQILLQRSRSHLRQEPPQEPVFARTFPQSSENIRQLSSLYAGLAQLEPVNEEIKLDVAEEEVKIEEIKEPLMEVNERAPEVDLLPPPQEQVRPAEEPRAIPEGIDPSFLEALPDDIRNEILSQYQRPVRDEGANDEFLQALPLEIRNEIIMQQRPNARPVQEMDNATFIASLTPELRREVLVSANEEFLSTLPPDLVAEARILQDRFSLRDQYLLGRQAPKKKQHVGEDKTIANIVMDEKLANSVALCDDALLEVLFKGLYLSTPISRDILISLFLNFSVQNSSRSKILDGLVALLLHLENKAEFPPSHLYGSESFLENYTKVYAIVSVRILDILHELVQSNPRVSIDLISLHKHRLSIIKAIKPEESISFQDLISLMDQNLYRTSASHLTPLISLISVTVNSLAGNVPSLDQIAVDRLCSLLSFESLNEATVKIVVEMVTKLSDMESNKEQVAKALKYQLRQIGEELLVSLNRLDTPQSGLKEIQLLRLCKVISKITETIDDIDFLWEPLSVVLTEITQKETQLASTTNPVLNKLLPLIESFFISHYNRSQTETFRVFTEKNCKVINLLIRQNPNLLYDTFNSLVLRFPFLLDFENKRVYFKSALRDLKREIGNESIRLNVRRHEVFMDSFHQLKVRSPEEMHGKLRVQFVGEEGLDAGGVTREWYGLLSRELFNPNYALFIPSANGVSFQPNSMSSINTEHIQFFKFVGRIIGKALCDSCSLDVYFTRSFYKHILGQEVTYQDMEDLDVDFFKSLKFLMDINLDEGDLHEYYFAYEEEEFGRLQVKELVPEGKTKRVTEQNKLDYIKLLCNMKMTKNIQAQIDAFKAGFHEMIPVELVSIFDSKELELLISGLPTVDIDDLKDNTEYSNYTETSQVILWLWEVLYEFSREERAEFIQFVTGSSKVPLDGFKALPGMGGYQKFQIHKCFSGTERLPTAHTCMNQLDLPEYTSKEQLKNRLKLAITEGKEGFGFV